MKKILLIQFHINPQICCRMIHILAIGIKILINIVLILAKLKIQNMIFLLYTSMNYLEKKVSAILKLKSC